jgi:C4-dicarboxylate-specific signal transduction histidine kinase
MALSWSARLVRANPIQFETVLVNLAVNALNAMKGEGTLTTSP